MKPYRFTSENLPLTLKIDKFRGVDFETHPSKVDFSRSPDMLNMMPDEGCFPVKRLGYMKIDTPFSGMTYGLHRFINAGGNEEILVHNGIRMYKRANQIDALTITHISNAYGGNLTVTVFGVAYGNIGVSGIYYSTIEATVDRIIEAVNKNMKNGVAVKYSADTIHFYALEKVAYPVVALDASTTGVTGTATIFNVTGTYNVIYSSGVVPAVMASYRSVSFSMNGKLYLLDGSNYQVYGGTYLNAVTSFEGENAPPDKIYVPTTLYGAYPNGAKPLGVDESDEPVNVLTGWQRNMFIAEGGTKRIDVLELWVKPTASGTVTGSILGYSVSFAVTSATSLDQLAEGIIADVPNATHMKTKTSDGIKVIFYANSALTYATPIPTISFSTCGAEGSVYNDTLGVLGEKVYKLSGRVPLDDVMPIVKINDAVIASSHATYGWTYSYSAGTVTFLNAPEAVIGGVPSVEITFKKTVYDSAKMINKCTIASVYGGNFDTRVFLSGNPSFKNSDFVSGLFDPTYFGETSYTKIGSDRSAIVGYSKIYDTQIIVKEDNEQDSSEYLRSFSFDSSGRPMFPLVEGVNSYGAISKYAFATLGDIPLYLSKDGVIGIFSTSVKQQSSMKNVSRLVNNRLMKEANLKDAFGLVYHDKYYLCVNGNCYIADGKQRYYDDGTQFEWYFWDNIFATCMIEFEDNLYFGKADGLYRFYHETERFDGTREILSVYNDNGVAINAYWATPLSAFNDWTRYKKILNFFAVGVPHVRSSMKIYYFDEKNYGFLKDRNVLEKKLDLFDFRDIDFGRFSFQVAASPVPFATNVKQSKVKCFQAVMQNKVMDEPFGILGFEIKYLMKNLIR